MLYNGVTTSSWHGLVFINLAVPIDERNAERHFEARGTFQFIGNVGTQENCEQAFRDVARILLDVWPPSCLVLLGRLFRGGVRGL